MNRHGDFIWYELLTRDIDAAAAFYADVVGWTLQDSGTPGIDYRLFTAPDGQPVAGLMAMPDAMPAPTWLGYVAVDDVDAAAADFVGAGGHQHMPPTTMPGVGRMAMLTDPQAAALYLMRGERDTASTSFCGSENATPGHFVWNELTAPDQDRAIAFYADRFGWRQEGGMPMGPLGDYKFLHNGDTCLGAAMGMVPGGQVGWQYYALVADIDAATARIVTGGGSVIQGPDEIPGGSFSVVASDPMGARFGLVGPRA
ncbi:VOC family protein [Sphingomonas sp. 2R-10]|uniref:VOC family protein n=1 Tax=Sphingomonas sp. 2R-10 TaxID=3045148 RepID=UPI000F7A23A9|nr:VOC family protein [Sphingomonas sp. 2R-10]MDJ0278574.1 VOC family protein [Sphingomonas sp. 2R-10]